MGGARRNEKGRLRHLIQPWLQDGLLSILAIVLRLRKTLNASTSFIRAVAVDDSTYIGPKDLCCKMGRYQTWMPAKLLASMRGMSRQDIITYQI